MIVEEHRGSTPPWADFRDLALGPGLQRLLVHADLRGGRAAARGTFAIYYLRSPARRRGDLALIDVLVRTVGMAIDPEPAATSSANASSP